MTTETQEEQTGRERKGERKRRKERGKREGDWLIMGGADQVS